MASGNLVSSVAYCGLACALCWRAHNQGCTGCASGGGDANCHQRKCCLEKGLKGCWECEDFPCDKGYFVNPLSRGFKIAFLQVIKERGIDAFAELLQSRFGEVVKYEDFGYKEPEEIKALLRGEPE